MQTLYIGDLLILFMFTIFSALNTKYSTCRVTDMLVRHMCAPVHILTSMRAHMHTHTHTHTHATFWFFW